MDLGTTAIKSTNDNSGASTRSKDYTESQIFREKKKKLMEVLKEQNKLDRLRIQKEIEGQLLATMSDN